MTWGRTSDWSRDRGQSGDRSPQLPITKAGDGYLRRLLVGSSRYILAAFFDRIQTCAASGSIWLGGGGKNDKKRAIVAVAREACGAHASIVGHGRNLRSIAIRARGAAEASIA